MKLATWNVNSIRKRVAQVRAWLAREAPDVLLLQEMKCEARDFPELDFAALGYRDPRLAARDEVFALVNAGFATRRKMLRKSLASLVDPAAFAVAGVDPEARAETLGVAEWGRLACAAREACSTSAQASQPAAPTTSGGSDAEPAC